MAIHYITDCPIGNQNSPAGWAIDYWKSIVALYHFLRVMGWSLIEEKSGLATSAAVLQIADQHMMTEGTSYWTALGTATLAKDKTNYWQNFQSLKITSNAQDDGVRCDPYEAGGATACTYYVEVWAANDSGDSWDIAVDPGTGSFASIGSIPDNGGVWTKYTFSYTRTNTANNYIRVTDNNNTQGYIHIQDLNVWRSWFEDSAYESGTDGDIVNGDEFSSVGYTFDSGDVGKFLVDYDAANPENSGVWKILSISSGNAVLDLRVGGAEVLTNTTSHDLVWRLYNPALAPSGLSSSPTEEESTGNNASVLLESPHSSHWRFTLRLYQALYNNPVYVFVYGSPIDADYQSGAATPTTGLMPSTAGAPTGDFNGYQNQGMTCTPGTSADRTGRFYAMVADDGAFVSWANRWTETADYLYTTAVVGIISDDENFTDRERWALLAANYAGGNEQGTLDTDTTVYSYVHDAWSGTETARTVKATVPVYNIHTDVFISNANCQENQYSGEEWVVQMMLHRNWNGKVSEEDSVEIAMNRENAFYYTRENMTSWTTFDSHNYLHLCNGIVWPWHGRSLVA